MADEKKKINKKHVAKNKPDDTITIFLIFYTPTPADWRFPLLGIVQALKHAAAHIEFII